MPTSPSKRDTLQFVVKNERLSDVLHPSDTNHPREEIVNYRYHLACGCQVISADRYFDVDGPSDKGPHGPRFRVECPNGHKSPPPILNAEGVSWWGFVVIFLALILALSVVRCPAPANEAQAATRSPQRHSRTVQSEAAAERYHGHPRGLLRAVSYFESRHHNVVAKNRGKDKKGHVCGPYGIFVEDPLSFDGQRLCARARGAGAAGIASDFLQDSRRRCLSPDPPAACQYCVYALYNTNGAEIWCQGVMGRIMDNQPQF